MTLRVRAVLAIGAVAALLGCSDAPVPTVPRETADFTEMRDLWEATGIVNYDVDLTIGSESALPYTLRIEVRNSTAQRVYESAIGWRFPLQSELPFVVDSLYARIATERADPGANVLTNFDTSIGLLTYIAVDRPAVANDAYWYEVKRFVQR